MTEAKEPAGTRDCWHEWPRSGGLVCQKLLSCYTKLSEICVRDVKYPDTE